MTDEHETLEPAAGGTADDTGDDRGALSRRAFVLAGGAAAAGMSMWSLRNSASASAAPGQAVEVQGPSSAAGRPNILVITADEYRYPVAYESDALREFRTTHLVGEEALRDNGLEFTNHYVMSSACAPSRTSFLTGQYPSLHGVSQTSGAAKTAFEEDCYWLDPNTVPTMGDYFRAGGYDTYIKGKWHVSEADILVPGTKNALFSFDEHGNPDPVSEAAYRNADRLDGFGFTGWIGPEAHGPNPLNSASSATDAIARDPKFADQAVEMLDELASRDDDTPWLFMAGFLDPHDITTWGAGTLNNPAWFLEGQLDGSAVPDQPFDHSYAATATEDLSTKPSCQQSYVDTYPVLFQPIVNNNDYRRFYYQLQANVNAHIKRVLDTLASHPEMAENTIVVFTSDHGTLLGAHGGMYQKWHQAYEEATHVPFIIHSPSLFSGRQTIDAPTSQADLLPTLLGLAGLDEAELAESLAATHNEVHPLVGRDLSPVILGEASPETLEGPVYFMTDDEVSRGTQQISPAGRMYESVIQPNHVSTVIAMLPTGDGGALEKWKYSQYTDRPQFWSNPVDPQTGTTEASDIVTIVNGVVSDAGHKTAATTVKDVPVPEEVEVYNLAADPLEVANLAGSHDPRVQAAIAQLATMLAEQCATKLVTPRSGVVPSQSTDCDAPAPPPPPSSSSSTTSSSTSTTSTTTTTTTTPTSSSSTSSAAPSSSSTAAPGSPDVLVPRYTT